MSNADRRVAMFYPHAGIDTVPSLCSVIALLADAGFEIDVFTEWDPATFVSPKFASSTINVFDDFRTWEKKGVNRLLPERWAIQMFLLRRHLRVRYTCVIGVDPEGLVLAWQCNRFINAPVLYYSLELLLSYELDQSRRDLLLLKDAERRLSQKCSLVVIQDERRRDALAKDNGIPLERFVLLPNAPEGAARRKPSRYWHRKFGLPERTKVVLYVGNICEWCGIGRIARSVDSWPTDWVLVVHTRFHSQASYPVMLLKELVNEKRVFVSSSAAGRDEYEELVDGAHVGIAFYLTLKDSPVSYMLQDNLRLIGLSSGKVAYYLRAGVPVIVNRTTTLAGFVKKNGCGVSVEDEKAIGKALCDIEGDYAQFSENALAAYRKHLDIKAPGSELVSRIKNIVLV